MLTGLKVSSLACQCVFYRTKQNAQRGLNLEPVDKAWRADEKNGVILLVITFTPRVMVIKMSKNGSCFVFFADDSKILVTV